MVDKEDIKDHETEDLDQKEEDQDQEDRQELGVEVDYQDILGLLQLLTMITLLPLGLVQEVVILLPTVLALTMVLPVVLTQATLLPLELPLGTQHLQEQAQATLLLGRPLQGYSLQGIGVG